MEDLKRAWKERVARQGEYLREYRVDYLTPEKKAQIRKQAKAHRSTPAYKKRVAEAKRKYNATPEGKRKLRNVRIKKKYGLSPEQWDQIFDSQGRCCAICKSIEPGSLKGWHTDHCHVIEKVRGILCSRCNKALGLFKENLKSLKSAVSYLLTHKEQ